MPNTPAQPEIALSTDTSPTSAAVRARVRKRTDEPDVIWSAPPGAPSTPAPADLPVVSNDALPAAIEAALVELLLAPLPPGETSHAGNRRKEHAIGAMLDGLAIPQARALQTRLSRPCPDDALATAFGRLVSDRRDRLLDFLGDARRRDAIRRARAATRPTVQVTVRPWSPR